MPSLNTLGSFVFDYAAEKRTNKQTASNVLPMPTNIVSVGNNVEIKPSKTKCLNPTPVVTLATCMSKNPQYKK